MPAAREGWPTEAWLPKWAEGIQAAFCPEVRVRAFCQIPAGSLGRGTDALDVEGTLSRILERRCEQAKKLGFAPAEGER